MSWALGSMQPSQSFRIPVDPSLVELWLQFPLPYSLVFPRGLSGMPPSTMLASFGIVLPSLLIMRLWTLAPSLAVTGSAQPAFNPFPLV